MKYRAYWGRQIKWASAETLSLLGYRHPIMALVALVISVAAFAVFVTRGASEQGILDTADYLVAVLEALLLSAALLFLLNLTRAPVIHFRDARRQLSECEAEIAAQRAEIADLRDEERRRVDDVTRVGEELLISRARVVASGAECLMAESENAARLISIGEGEVQIDWAIAYKDISYQLAIKPTACWIVRHSKAPSSVGIAFVRLDGFSPTDSAPASPDAGHGTDR